MPASRITDMHVCPMVTPGVPPIPHVGGPIIGPGAPTVLTGSLPQARVTDTCVCVGPPDVIVMGAFNVLAMGLPAARIGDTTAHGGKIILGLPTVLIGTSGGGGGGGAGGGGGGGTGANSVAGDLVAASTTGIAPAQQAAVYKHAAKTAAPFCERCQA